MKPPVFTEADYEGFDLDSMLCTRCTLGCNVIRFAPRDGKKLLLCGKKRATQDMLNIQREKLGIPAPGERMQQRAVMVGNMVGDSPQP